MNRASPGILGPVRKNETNASGGGASDRCRPFVSVRVGPENVAQELKDTSVVVTRFDIGDGMQGMIGVVGPQRMDYAQITARLSYFAEGLGRMFGKPELPAAPKPEVHEAKEEE